jgi:membrane protein
MTEETRPAPARSRALDRQRVLRLLTFWLRPHFVLRVINRFQKIAGFDRAVALASSSLTAIIPLAIVASAIVSHFGGRDAADRIIDRYELTGGGADAVRDLFAPANDASTSIGIIGFFFLLLAVLSFTRAMQRLFEQTWELKPLSVRNTINGLLWIAGLSVFITISGTLHALLGRGKLEVAPALLVMPVSAVFLVWSGRILSAQRIARTQLVPFAVIGAVAGAVYSVGASVYVPHLFNVYATRYGAIGAVFAMISTLFCIMVVVAASAAAGREIRDELDRIRRGEVPPENEVRRQWEEVTAEARSRWAIVRERAQRRKS